jgi:hypothetical protein
MLATVTYSLQELEQSSFVAIESNLREIDLPELKETDLPQFLLSIVEYE